MPDRTQPRKTNNSYIATRRRELGITQGQLCSMLCCSHGMASRWESGQCCPGGRYLIQLAQVLACDPSDIVADYNNRKEGGA